MDPLLEWVQQIAVFYLFMVILEQLLPSETYRKYVRLYLGLVFVLIVLLPITNFSGLENSLIDALKQVQTDIAKDHLRLEKEAGNEKRYQAILDGYRAIIQENVQELVGRKGFVLDKIDINLEEDVETDNFARIYSMKIQLTGDKTEQILKIIQEDLAREYELDITQIEMIVKEGG